MVGTVSRRLVAGSDVTLNCTISRFSDTLSLHWKQRYPFRHNRGNNTDEIRLNDSVYLIIRNIERNSFTCVVQENNATVIAAAIHLYAGRYNHASIIDTRYRSSTSYSEFHLVSDITFWRYRHFAWIWMSHHYPNQDRQIASFNTSHHVNLNRTYFGNRITTQHYFWRHHSIFVQIAPVLFDDAGVYALIVDSVNHVTITLITVKVTAEPSDAVTEGDSVTLTCFVSNVTEAIRLAWINSDGKSVLEKTLTGQNGEEKSLSLIIQKADRCKWHWMCVLFDQNNPRVSIPYNLEITRRSCMDTWILAFSGYLLVKLIIAIGLITSLKRAAYIRSVATH